MKVEVKTYWSDINQAKDFAEDISVRYPNLKVYLSLESDVKNVIKSDKKKEDIY